MVDDYGVDSNTESGALEPTEDATQVPVPVDAGEYEEATGEKLAHTLDIQSWQPGEDLGQLYGRLEREIEDAVHQENRIRERIRQNVFPLLQTRPGSPTGAGVYVASVEQLEEVHHGLLFNGAVEACDGTSIVHDTLPVTITQIGVCLVSYQGDQGSYVHRIFRRDVRVRGTDPVDEAMEVLDRRRQRTGFDNSSRRDVMSDLLRRGIMAYAERAVLLRRSDALWRMGHGNPAPYELLTGSGSRELLESSLGLLRELVLDHQRFVFVPSAPADRMLLTIGNALRPLEYAIVDTLSDRINRVVEQGHYRGDWASLVSGVREFAADAGSKVIIGVYRASAMSPPHMFFAHADHVHKAAMIAMADSTLQEHRGFPMMIDLADSICRTTFGSDTLIAPTQVAYAQAGEPFRYLTERQTRK
jgi:hypothetical protein